jgi:hypothetical protein
MGDRMKMNDEFVGEFVELCEYWGEDPEDKSVEFTEERLKGMSRALEQTASEPQDNSKGFIALFWDNPSYLEHQWAENTLVAFGREGHGEEDDRFQNLGSILCHFARWCDANDLHLSDVLKIGATLYNVETNGKGKQFIKIATLSQMTQR